MGMWMDEAGEPCLGQQPDAAGGDGVPAVLQPGHWDPQRSVWLWGFAQAANNPSMKCN